MQFRSALFKAKVSFVIRRLKFAGSDATHQANRRTGTSHPRLYYYSTTIDCTLRCLGRTRVGKVPLLYVQSIDVLNYHDAFLETAKEGLQGHLLSLRTHTYWRYASKGRLKAGIIHHGRVDGQNVYIQLDL
jgi:hypothetical protein